MAVDNFENVEKIGGQLWITGVLSVDIVDNSV
jgi:hypothetical protein